MVQDRCPIGKAARGRGEWVEKVMEEGHAGEAGSCSEERITTRCS
jgi:hypothetical protein